MKKKYIIHCVNFEVRHYYRLGFSALLNNQNDFSLYKRRIFTHLINAIEKQKKELINKNKTFSFFLKALRLKGCIQQLKVSVGNKLSQTQQSFTLMNKFQISQRKKIYFNFINRVKKKVINKKLQIHQNISFMQGIYLRFFKTICKQIAEKTKLKKTFRDAENVYLYKLARKALKALYINLLINEEETTQRNQRMIIGRIFFNNLKQMHNEISFKGLVYRKRHLKKYYFTRLRRTIYSVKLNRIARIKFITKFFLNWRQAVLMNKRTRAEGSFKLNQTLTSSRNRLMFLHLKFFYNQLKWNYMESVQNEINELKILKFLNYLQKKKKLLAYKSIKYNRLINICERKRIFFMKKNCLNVIKFMKDISVPIYLKIEEADEKYKAKLYKRIKYMFYFLRKEITLKKRKIFLFRQTFLKIKIFKMLKLFAQKNKALDSLKVKRFRNFFLSYNLFSLLKLNSLIAYRENKIIKGVKKILAKNRIKYLYWSFNSIRLNFLCERFKREREFKLKIKIFYALKMLSTY